MSEFRITHDTLGKVKVPGDAYYGAQTQRACENFPVSSLKLPRAFIKAQGLIKWAAARAHLDLGELPEDIGQSIIKAAEEVINGKWDQEFVVDAFQAGAGTSQNMNANEVIASRAAELLGAERGDYKRVHPNDHVNKAQSTNDTIHVAINLAALDCLEEMLPVLKRMQNTFQKKAADFTHIIKSGRTHLQDAVPMSLGQEFAGYADTLQKQYQQLVQVRSSLYEIGLGGNAVGTGINANPMYAKNAIQYIAEKTGFPLRPAKGRFMFMQNTHSAIHLSEALKELALHLIKITSDLRLLSSGPRTGLAEIRLPAVQPGSSIMPGKVNPVMLEMMYMVCAQVIGNNETITIAGIGSQLEINVMMPVIAHNLLQSIALLTHSMEVVNDKCIRGIEADQERCKYWVEQSLSLATALNPLIGYEKAAAIAKKAYTNKRKIIEVAEEDTNIDKIDLDRILDPRNLI
jgi:fumarate hydratase class II